MFRATIRRRISEWIARCAIHSCVSAALVGGALAPASASPLTPDDLTHLVTIADPQLSPDGRRAVAVVSHIDLERDATVGRVDLIDLRDGGRRPLTFERSGVRSPQWSPDGGRIAFIADAGSGAEARPQVFVMRLDGGDPRRVTAAPEGVEQFAWRPDGRAIAYVALDPAPKVTGPRRFVDAYEVTDGSLLLPGGARAYRVWLQSLDAARPTLLTPGPGSVTNGESASTLSFSSDGRRVSYLWARDAILNQADFATVHVVDTVTGTARQLTTHAGHERDPQFAPRGDALAYLYADGDPQTHPQDAFVTAGDGGSGSDVSAPLDTYVHDTAWRPDGGALYFTSTVGTRSAIWRRSGRHAPQRVPIGALCTLSPLAGAVGRDGTLVLVASTASTPPELYVVAPGRAPRAVSDYNRLVAARSLGTGERITYPTTTGVTGDAVLFAPRDLDRASRAPLVVMIHGGPTDASTESFDDLAQLMIARGWRVLEPNYRGSNNLGRRYLASIFDDVSTGPGRDIMAALAAVQSRGIVDPARIAVSGWSYGGVMTTWMIARYHVWRAAVSGAGVTDWIADYATADDLNEDLFLFRGSPFVATNRARWLHEESITYVADVRTPVLLLADRGDARVPITSSYEFFHALRDLGKPAQFVVYPVDGHFPHDPARAADVYARWINYIGGHFSL